MDNENIPKIPNLSKVYECISCNIKTSNKKDYTKHILTTKHLKNQNGYEKIKENPIFPCECGNIYKHSSGLWRHKKLCKVDETDIENTIIDASSNEIKVLTNLVIELVKNNTELQKQTSELQKQNQDFQKQVLEICKNNNTTINNNNSTNNSNNKTFNLQVFLNEECKDAMNMSEFINSIELKITDLENIGKLGYIEGMSNIIIKQLKDTDMYKRPVHCSDAKRETLYVKEENKWEKESQETKQMLSAVRGVNKKNYQMLTKWKETHPKCMDSESKQSDEYMKIVSKVMDGDVENINKVIKKVAKEVVIDK